MTPIKR